MLRFRLPVCRRCPPRSYPDSLVGMVLDNFEKIISLNLPRPIVIVKLCLPKPSQRLFGEK